MGLSNGLPPEEIMEEEEMYQQMIREGDLFYEIFEEEKEREEYCF